MKTALEKFTTARAQLVAAQPFWGSLALHLKIEECAGIATADVDGATIRFNPEFVTGLTQAETIGVFAHEIGHCALGHIWRLAGRDHDRWNQACDHAINPILAAAGFTLPRDALNDPRYAGMSADEIYGLIPATPRKARDKPGMGEMRQPVDGAGAPASPAAVAQQAVDWQVATIQAVNAGQAAGLLPAGMVAAIDATKEPQADWQALLRRFIASAMPSDYSWFPPNRRHVAAGLYLPALKPDRLGMVAVVRDTSGSTQALQATFLAELTAILDEVQPDRVMVIDCDARIQAVADYRPGEIIEPRMTGGGGTDFRPPFQYLADQGEAPAVMIYLTDLEGAFPAEAPDYPVLWAAVGKAPAAPFGETLRIGRAG